MPASEIVRGEINANGPIPFSRYMELALYHPAVGFYAHRGAGRRGDFITSPETGPLFGVLVARALDTCWEELGRPDRFTFVEAGAGPGTLARSILRARPRCREALEYVAVDASTGQRHQHPDEVISVSEMPESIDAGMVLANELLDNIPFDIMQCQPGRGWREVRVGSVDGGLVEVLVQTDFKLESAGGTVGSVRVPVQSRAGEWLRKATASLRTGRVVVIDYCVPRYPVEQGRDWLRTYSGHTRGGPPLEDPGTKDITADVDVAALRASLPTTHEQSQATWLRCHGIDQLVEEGRRHWHEHAAVPDLTAVAMRSRVNEAEALLDPDGLGGFTVLEWAVG